MRIGPAIGAGLAAALAIGLALPTYAAPAGRPAREAARSGLHQAEQALAHVRALFDAATRPRPAGGAPQRDATLALRDLVRVRGQLRGTAAREADRLLARPAPGHASCTPRICVHWNPADVRCPDYIDQSGRPTVNDVPPAAT